MNVGRKVCGRSLDQFRRELSAITCNSNLGQTRRWQSGCWTSICSLPSLVDEHGRCSQCYWSGWKRWPQSHQTSTPRHVDLCPNCPPHLRGLTTRGRTCPLREALPACGLLFLSTRRVDFIYIQRSLWEEQWNNSDWPDLMTVWMERALHGH